MPSTRSDRPRLASRVAMVGAVAAAIGGAVAAAVSGAVAGTLVAEHEDDAVLAATNELAEEIVEDLDEDDDDDDQDDDDDDDMAVEGPRRPTLLASVLAHELKDVKHPGAMAAIRVGSTTTAGEPSLPQIAPGACTSSGEATMALRTCAAALPDGQVLVLAVSAADERERFALIAWALVVGALVGAGLGGALGRRSATWAMIPVNDLRDRVRAIDPASPDSEGLRPPATHAEIEDLRAAVAQLVDRLGASIAHAQAFAAQAAHELRTPLSLLSGELELMLEGGERGPADARVLARMHGIVADLVALTQRLLILAGPGRSPAERGEPIDLSDVAEAVVAALPHALSARVHVRPGEDVVVRGDFELLRSMLHNAVDNALKFSAGPVTVGISLADDAVLEVRDEGPGLGADDRRRVFAPFVRAASGEARGVPGHGIGLALIAHVAQAHGGQAMFVDSERGACLRIRLPRWRSHPDAE